MGDGDDVTGPVAVVLMGVGFLALLVGIIVKVIVITLRARGEAGPRAG